MQFQLNINQIRKRMKQLNVSTEIYVGNSPITKI